MTEENANPSVAEAIAEDHNDTIAPAAEETIEGVEGEDTIEPAGDPAPEPKPEEEPKPQAKKKPWFMDEISQGRERARRAEAERDAFKALAEAKNSTPETLAEAEIERRAQEKAQLIAQNLNSNNKVVAVGNAGRQKYADFNESADVLGQIGLAQNPQFLEIVTKLENAPDIIYKLGKNPEEALRISNLSAIDQALELGKMQTELSKGPVQKKVSQAPAPIKPVTGGSSGSGYTGEDPSRMDDEQFYQVCKRVC